MHFDLSVVYWSIRPIITDDEIGLGSQISTDPITLSTPTDEGISIDLQLIILGYNHILLLIFL